MKHSIFACWKDFQCAAGDCPDSCCQAGWEIVVDPETLARVSVLPGPDAPRVRAAILEGEEPVWRSKDGVCTLLDPDGLCHLQRHYGADALCRVCRDYPRYTRYFGARTEHGLSLSCPHALALLLAPKADLSLWSYTDEAPVVPHDLDAGRYDLLLRGRALAFSLLRQTTLPAEHRMALVLALALGLDPDRNRRPERILKRLASPIGQAAALERLLPRCGDMTRYRSLSGWTAALERLERLSPRWTEDLKRLQRFLARASERGHDRQTRRAFAQTCPQDRYCRYLMALLHKYWMDACAEGHLTALVKRALFQTLMVRELHLMDFAVRGSCSAPLPAMWQLAREVEHSEENLALLLELMETEPCFERRSFGAVLCLDRCQLAR